jgi:hypothetical protein
MIHNTIASSNNTAAKHSISSLNNKAIQLVQQGDGRNAVRLFLQALSSLKSEIKQVSPTTGKSHGAMPPSNGSGFLRVSLPISHAPLSSMSMYDTLFAMTPTCDPCAPTQRDGSTACLLYNMALSHQRRCVDTMSDQPNKGNLRKAVTTYYMALAAAQHWKKHTAMSDHEGYPILTLAIVNNLLVIHHELGNRDKVVPFQGLLRNAMFRVGRNNQGGEEISGEELSIFAKNLQRYHYCEGEIQAAAVTMSSSTQNAPCHVEATSGVGKVLATKQHPSAMGDAHGA